MFGIMNGCGLDREDRKAWIAHYCGVCTALGRYHGQTARLALNGDGVLLSMLAEAQSQAPYSGITLRCPARGFRPVDAANPDAPGVRYAAAVTALMGASRIDDHLADEDVRPAMLRMHLRKWSARWRRTSRASSSEMGFSPDLVEKEIRTLFQREKSRGENFSFYAGPTENASALTAAHTAVLAGAPENRDALYHIGRLYGRIIYLVDSLSDFFSDNAENAFNALANATAFQHVREDAASLFSEAADGIRSGLQTLAFPSGDLPVRMLNQRLAVLENHLASSSPFHLSELGTGGCLSRDPHKKKWYDSCDCCDCGCDACDCSSGDGGCGCGGDGGCDCGCDGCDCGC